MSESLLVRAFSKWQRLSVFKRARWGRTSIVVVDLPAPVLGLVQGSRGINAICLRRGLPHHIALATLLHEMSHAKCGWRPGIPWGTHSTEWRKTFVAAISEVTGMSGPVVSKWAKSEYWLDWYAERSIARTLQRCA